jgi:hypothetical protein
MADRTVYKGHVIERASYQSEGAWIPKALVRRRPEDAKDVGDELAFADAAVHTREAADEYALAAAKRWIDEHA